MAHRLVFDLDVLDVDPLPIVKVGSGEGVHAALVSFGWFGDSAITSASADRLEFVAELLRKAARDLQRVRAEDAA